MHEHGYHYVSGCPSPFSSKCFEAIPDFFTPREYAPPQVLQKCVTEVEQKTNNNYFAYLSVAHCMEEQGYGSDSDRGCKSSLGAQFWKDPQCFIKKTPAQLEKDRDKPPPREVLVKCMNRAQPDPVSCMKGEGYFFGMDVRCTDEMNPACYNR
jgi:hypothetical protein